jgi:hypothetical protein
MRNILLVTLAWFILFFIAPFVFISRATWRAFKSKEMLDNYLGSVSLSMDYLGCNILYGVDNHSISAVTFLKLKTTHKTKYKYLHKFINTLFQDDLHCFKAYKHEYKGK